MESTRPSTDPARGSAPPPLDQHLRSANTRRAMRVQQQVLRTARQFLADAGCVELLPPVIGPVTDPGVRGSKQIDVDYYGHRYKLMTSAILYKQAALLAFPRLFYLATNVRAEPPETAGTGRHLTEFHQIDVELAGASRDDAARLAEGLLVAIVGQALASVPDELIALGRDPIAFQDLLAEPFDSIRHEEAVARLVDLQYRQSPTAEIAWEGEEMLSQKATKPFFITDYPKGSRGFYDREDPAEPGRLRNFDLIAPLGSGELVSGSEREYEYPRLVTRMRETGENPAKYRWYLDLARKGLPRSAGFGMGLERVTRFLTGLDSVWQVSAFPRMPGFVDP